jgi:hypothetical protein
LAGPGRTPRGRSARQEETPGSCTGVGDRAAGDGTESDVQAGGRIIDVHGGDPVTAGGGFTTSIAVAKALISALNAGCETRM